MIPLLVATALTIPQAVTAAQARYGPAPCGEPTVVVADPPSDARDAAGWVTSLTAPDCVIHIASTIAGDPEIDCAIVTHEYRHLAGQGHNDDPVNPDPAGPSGLVLEIPDWCVPVRTIYVPFGTWDVATADGWGT